MEVLRKLPNEAREFKLLNDLYIKKTGSLYKKGSKFYEDTDIDNSIEGLIHGYFIVDKFDNTESYCLNIELLKEIKPSKFKIWLTKEAETMNIFKAMFWCFFIGAFFAFGCGNVLAGLVNSLVSVFCYLFSARIKAIDKKEKEEIKKPYDIFNTIEKVEEKKPFIFRKYFLKIKPWISAIFVKVFLKLIDVTILYLFLEFFKLLK